MPEKPSRNKERLKEITDRIEAGIKDIFESGDLEKYRDYLRTMSRFHTYSVNNQALIHMQRPDATFVAGYNRWRDKFSRHVLRGEKGITIIAPTPYKKKIEQEKLDPNTKKPVLDENGLVVMEEKEVQIPMFRAVSVFDVSQTAGKPLPERMESPVATLTGSVENYEAFMEALRRSSPVPIEMKPLSADTDGYFNISKQVIALRENMSEVQTVSAAVHEIAHARLHNYAVQQAQEAVSAGKETPKPKSRNTEEVEAESVSFAVCAFFGIETGANSFGYVATWSKNAELPEFRASLETINHAAGGIISDVEKHFAEVCKERGIKLPKEPEYVLVTFPPSREDALGFAADYVAFLRKDTKISAASDLALAEKIAEKLCAGEEKTLRAELEDMVELENELNIDNGAGSLLERFKGLFRQEWQVKEEPQAEEALYLLEDRQYLHIQLSAGGTWDYTFYDKETRKQLDGGLLDKPDLNIDEVKDVILMNLCFDLNKVQTIPQEALADLLENLRIANELSLADDEVITDAQVKPYEPDALPPLPEMEQGYPMPDHDIGFLEMYQYGYTDGNTMLPLTKERAMELFLQDVPVFLLYGDNTEAMALDTDDIDSHTGVFGVERSEWDSVRGIIPQTEQADIEKQFLENPSDAFLIYQIRQGGELEPYRFMNYDFLQSKGVTPDRSGYDAIYTGDLLNYGNTGTNLDILYQTFNINRPEDFRGHSLSVSDIVAIRQNDVVSCHYVDSIGFRELPNFLQPENYLKNVEVLLEDDFGMIDGIINNGPKEPTVADLEAHAKARFSISLTDLAAASRREQTDKRKSVLEQLKTKSQEQSTNKTAPKWSAEREL